MQRWNPGSTVLLAILASNAFAGPLTFTFSFTNTTGNTPGTVTGRILGLSDNGTGPASQVFIDAYPRAYDPTPFSLPIDAALWPGQFQNTFTVSRGAITSARFDATGPFRSGPPPSQFVLNFTTTLGEFFDTTSIPTCCSNYQTTFGPIRFTQVPEPNSLSLLFVGAGVAGFIRSRRS